MTYADEIEQRAKLLDPQYQSQLYMIEQAQREAKKSSPSPVTRYPSDFDDKLMQLIDSVPME